MTTEDRLKRARRVHKRVLIGVGVGMLILAALAPFWMANPLVSVVVWTVFGTWKLIEGLRYKL